MVAGYHAFMFLFLALACSADADRDGHPADVDCDDRAVDVHPGAGDATCDGIDDDCDGRVDEDAGVGRVWYADSDGDGFGDFQGYQVGCVQPPDFVEDFRDCDDSDGAVHPGVLDDACDGVDDDCDRDFDEDAASAVAFYRDDDGDGYGDPFDVVLGCDTPNGASVLGTDCDDDHADAHPGGDELCDDAIDGDCDGVTDEACGGPVEVDFTQGTRLLGGGADNVLFSSPIIFMSLTAGGDTDGDGLDELAVGAPGAYRDGLYYLGRVYVIENPVGPSTFEDAGDVIQGMVEGARAGSAVAFVDDADGDGDDEIAVGAPELVDGRGGVYLFHGGADLNRTTEEADAFFPGVDADGRAGASLANAGNLLGEPGALAIGAPEFEDDVGRIYVLDANADAAEGLDGAAAVIEGQVHDLCAGEALANAGDVDGDGIDDLLVGGGGYCDYADVDGRAWLLRGPLAGWNDIAYADARFDGEAGYGRAGGAVAGPGDVDGDGLADVFVAAPAIEFGGFNDGVVYGITGHPEGEVELAEAPIALLPADDIGPIGEVLASAGDVDGDSRADLLVSAPWSGPQSSNWSVTGGAFLATGIGPGRWELPHSGSYLQGVHGEGMYGGALAGGADLDGDGVSEIALGGIGPLEFELDDPYLGAVAILSTEGWF